MLFRSERVEFEVFVGIVRILSRYDRCWVRADILGGDGGTLACGVDAWLGYVG